MSLWPREDQGVPAETARAARAAFPKGTFCLRVRDELGVLFADAAFAELFARRGRPALAPGRLALISVLPYVEGLTDRQAADAVRARLDWKYLLGLELDDPGFDASVLCEFRARLTETGSGETLIFEAVLDRLHTARLLTAGGRVRTDSTQVLARIRELNRLELVGETLRAALEALAVSVPEWLHALADPQWFTRYGVRVDAYRLPGAEAERLAYALIVGRDGFRVLEAAWDHDAPGWLRQLPAVEVLRRVWIQHYYRDEVGVHWRTKTIGLPGLEVMIRSPYDPDARYAIKRGKGWTGYKTHLCEACTPDRPHLITQVVTTTADVADIEMTDAVHDRLARRALAPAEHLVDAAYISAEKVLTARDCHAIELIGPVRTDTSWQHQNGYALGIEDFAIDWDRAQVRCPAGHTSSRWKPEQDKGHAVIHVDFRKSDCLPCGLRARCTRSAASARKLTLRPRDQHELLIAARGEQTTQAWKARYAVRAGIEGIICQATRAFGLRRCRYRGLAKTVLQQLLAATAINLVRADAWLCGIPLGRTRVSHLAALGAAA